MNEKINLLQKMINESEKIVFFGGAGVSTESGIKDFRSQDGIYNEQYKYAPEEILSHHFFINNTEEFYEFYKNKMNVLDKKPNIIHDYLVKLEKKGKLKAIITQNIDNLHQKAGSKVIYELHGNVNRNFCMKCNKFYDEEFIFNNKNIPSCSCTGLIKPDVVLYEESLNEDTLKNSINIIEKADMLIVAGTSLTVYPASGLIRYFLGKYLVIINRDTTSYDNIATLVINDSLKYVFENLN